MKPAAFKKLTISPEVDKLQENAALKFAQFDRMPFAGGNLLVAETPSGPSTRITLTGTAQTFFHGLGQTALGFLVLNKFANEDIWCTGLTEEAIQLQSSGSVDAIIWVF